MPKILIACEESQTVCNEFRKLGIHAYSCDLLPTRGIHPEWHIQSDVRDLIRLHWSMIIAFPPCTDLAVSGASSFAKKRANGSQFLSICFFLSFTDLPCKYVAIENPVGIMSTYYRKPDQIINPFQFGDPYKKKTCLWLKNLPKLQETNVVTPEADYCAPSGKRMPKWYADAWKLPKDKRSLLRSKTFPGIAEAMAKQWSKYVI